MTEQENSEAVHDVFMDPIGGPEEIVAAGGPGRKINLIFFVAVMAAIEGFDLLLTAKLHFASGSTAAQPIIDAVSKAGNTLFAVMLILSVFTALLARKATPRFALPMMVAYLSVASLNVLINIATMVLSPRLSNASQLGLIVDLFLIIISVTLIFSLWYQLVDSTTKGGAFDFPPCGPNPDGPPKWFDYLAMSFYANSTFGPTTEGIKSRLAKGLMMVQVSLSLTVLVVLVARIIKAT
ncbi:MAG: hypothetical protein WCI12_02650 [Actinomycetes bacterium]